MVGAGFSSTNKKGKKSAEWGVDLFGGKQKETWLDDPTHKTSFNVYGGRVFYNFNDKWAGIGIGLSGGNLRMADKRKVSQASQLEKGYYKTWLLPSASIRIGVTKTFFGEYRFADAFPTASPGYQSQLYLGTGFGQRNGFMLKTGFTGLSGGGGEGRFSLVLTFPIKNVMLTTNYAFGSNGQPGVTFNNSQFSMSVKYNFFKKK